jgi:DASS family divalent anion:Na+ symporter
VGAVKAGAAASEKNLLVRGIVTVLVAVIIWFMPPPEGVDQKAWHLFAIFFGTIVGLILQPLPLRSC